MRKVMVVFVLIGLMMGTAGLAISQEHHHVNFACAKERRDLVVLPTRYRGHRALGMVCERTVHKSGRPKAADWWIEDWQILYVWCEKDDGSFAKGQVVSVAWFSRGWVKAKCFTKAYWRDLGSGQSLPVLQTEKR